MKPNLKGIVCATICALLLAACSSPDLQISVKEKWIKAIENLALIPIYPMVEHIYVGDLRVVTNKTDSTTLSSRHLDHIDKIQKAHYDNSQFLPDFANTNSPPGALAATIWHQPTPTEESELSPRLRLAAFPNIGLASIRDTEFAGDGIADLWNWIPGFSSSDDRTLYLSVTGVETQEVDDRAAVKHFLEYLTTHNTSSDNGQTADNDLSRAVCASAAALDDPDGKNSYIVVVTRVFYARGIKYVYTNTAAAALHLAAVGDNASEVPVVEEERLDANRTEADAVKSMSEGKERIARAVPGIVARYAFADAGTLSLEEIFEKPMAFGASVLKYPLTDLDIECSCVKPLPTSSDRVVLNRESTPGALSKGTEEEC